MIAPVSVPDLFARGARIYRAALARCLPFSLAAVLAGQAPSVYLLARGESLALAEAKSPGWALVMGLAIVANLWSWLVLLRLQHAALDGAASSMRAEASSALRGVPQALLLLAVAVVLVALGLVALVVPGVYLAVALVPALSIAALERRRSLEIIDLALRRVRGLWWYTATVLLLTLIAVLGLFVVGGLLGQLFREFVGSAAPTVISAVLAALFQPFVTAILVVHHDVLRQASSSSNSA